MTATNHAITAANMALITKQWWILPLAFLSHFALDALPHYGDPTPEARAPKYKTVLSVDLIVLALFAWLVIMTAGQFVWLVIIVGFIAWSPDMVWFYRDYRERRDKTLPPQNWLTNFHAHIQKYERGWGWILEVVWFVAMLFAYTSLVIAARQS